jgi:hypothetical protein
MPPHAGFLQLSSPSDGILQPSPPTSPAHSHVEKNQLLPAFLDVFHAIKVASRILLTPASWRLLHNPLLSASVSLARSIVVKDKWF